MRECACVEGLLECKRPVAAELTEAVALLVRARRSTFQCAGRWHLSGERFDTNFRRCVRPQQVAQIALRRSVDVPDAPKTETRTHLGVATDARYLAFSACSRRRLVNGILPGKAGRPIGLSFRQSEQFPQGL